MSFCYRHFGPKTARKFPSPDTYRGGMHLLERQRAREDRTTVPPSLGGEGMRPPFVSGFVRFVSCETWQTKIGR